MLSRNTFRRSRRIERNLSLIGAMRAYRARKAYADRIATIEYEMAKRRQPVARESSVELGETEPHNDIVAENVWQRKCAEYRRLRHVMRRMVEYAERERINGLDMEMQSLRRLLPVTLPGAIQPAIQVKPVEPRKPAPTMSEFFGTRLAELIDRLKPEYRLDVAAQAACVRASHPDASADQVFARARSICRDVRRGRFCRDDQVSTISVDRERQSNSYRASDRQSILEHLDNLGSAHDLTGERLELIQATLDPTVIEGLRRGWTQSMIAEFMGVSPATVTRRIQAIRDGK